MISDKNKINVRNLPLNSIYNLNANNLNKKFVTAAKMNSSTFDEGKIENSFNTRFSRAQSTSFKFYKNANTTLRKSVAKYESGSSLRQASKLNFNSFNVNVLVKSVKKK